jgi:hypothetical protein
MQLFRSCEPSFGGLIAISLRPACRLLAKCSICSRLGPLAADKPLASAIGLASAWRYIAIRAQTRTRGTKIYLIRYLLRQMEITRQNNEWNVASLSRYGAGLGKPLRCDRF